MEKINSTKNSYISELRSLKQRKYRFELGKFLAEGEKCAEEALRYGDVEALLTVDECLPLNHEAEYRGARVILVSDAVMNAVSEFKTPQNAVAVVRKKTEPLGTSGIIAILDDVADPMNVGAIIRTADAIGAAGVLLSPGSADYTSPRAVRASMGSVFHLPVRIAEDFLLELGALKSRGFALVGGHLAGGEELPVTKNICIIVGNESRGLSEEIATLCDVLIRIPIYGKAESLNAAVAAGLLLYRAREKL